MNGRIVSSIISQRSMRRASLDLFQYKGKIRIFSAEILRRFPVVVLVSLNQFQQAGE